MRSFDALLEALTSHGKKTRRIGTKAMAQCPAHQDGRPSLSLTWKDGQTLVFCFAGCDTGAVMDALDLPLSELFDNPKDATIDNLLGYKLLIDQLPKNIDTANEPAEPIEYIYRDINGDTIAKKVRLIGPDGKKTFRQYLHSADGWIPGLGGIDLPLYNSDLIPLAHATNLPIYVVEGEKDADTVTALGEIAVTMPNGAGSWNDRYTTQLADITDIRIITDNDEPGINHAITVKQALEAAGATVTLLRPKDGCKDVTDHINAAGTLLDLIDADQQAATKLAEAKQHKLDALIAEELLRQQARAEAKRQITDIEAHSRYQLPEHTPTLTEELDKTDEPLRWLINHLWPEGANVTLTATYKAGKTSTVNTVIKALADQQPLFGDERFQPGNPGRIAVMNFEVASNQIRMWLRDKNIINTHLITLLNMRGYPWPMIHDSIAKRTIQWLTANNIETWIIDPLARAFVGCGDENSNQDMGTFLDQLDYIKEQAGVKNLLICAHTGRNNETGNNRARGASRFDDWADVRWILTKDDNDERFFAADGRDVNIEIGGLDWHPETRTQTFNEEKKPTSRRKAESEQTIQDIKNKMMQWIGQLNRPEFTRYELGAAAGFDHTTIGGWKPKSHGMQAIQQLIDAEVIEQLPKSGNNAITYKRL